ncbi:RDD family protein [Acinetobacter beijerinckii]|uniref:RDD family protein n=1 Tax=Acinetobacter beijerinckii TaxID=262668 RepID=UPI003008CAB5
MQIYLARNNQQAGPYSLEQLNQMLTSQQVLLTDLVWHEGMTEWKTLGELTQGKLVYEPVGYSPFSNQINNETEKASFNIKVEQKTSELAAFHSRALAKILDLMLWLPMAAIPSFFFNESQYKELFDIQKQLQATQMASTKAVELQQQLMQLIPNEAWMTMFAYLIIMLMIQAFFIAKSGQSIGKKIAKIKIVDVEQNTQVNTIRAFWLRSVLFIILNLLFMPFITLIDYTFFVFNKNRQTLHDKLAKTKVVKQ